MAYSSYNVLNTITGASDIALANSLVSITGAPSINFKSVQGAEIIRSLVATAKIVTVTYTSAANNTELSFSITQNIDETPVSKNFSYTTDSSATTTEAINAFTTIVNNSGMQVTAVATSATVMTITANAGYEIFNAASTTGAANFTVADAMTTYAPNATAALAVANVIAPHGTAATAIAGTTTVTVTTLAAHGLQIGDTVRITGVATMVVTGGLGNDLYRVATVPTTTTFTLANTTASGANSGTIVIRWQNGVIVNTLAASTLAVGNVVTIASIATMTVNGAASFTGRIRNVVTTSQFYVGSTQNGGAVVPNNSDNTGTITITAVAQYALGIGATLAAQGITGATTGNTYTALVVRYTTPVAPAFTVTARAAEYEHTVYMYDADADFPALRSAIQDAFGALQTNTILANPEAIAVF
jgi:hypothetical protein